MIKYYETLDKMLKENNFDIANSIVANNNILSTNHNGIIYICHFNIKNDGYTIDSCKSYKNKDEALGVFIQLLARSFENETR